MKWTFAIFFFLPCTAFAQTNQEPELLEQADEESVWVYSEDGFTRPEHQRIDGNEADQTPGTGGDALKAITKTSGVSRAPLGSQGVSILGAAPGDSAFFVDQIPVPRIFHLGGLRSILPSRSVSHYDLLSGGAPSRFGRAIGGTVDIRTHAPSFDDTPHISYRLDALDTGAEITHSFGVKTSINLSGRLSMLEQLFSVFPPSNASDLIPIPSYWDTQFKGQHKISASETISLTFLGVGDTLNRQLFAINPFENATDARRDRFFRLGASWSKLESGTFSRGTLYAGLDTKSFDINFGDTFASQKEDSRLLGLLFQNDKTIAPWLSLNVGFDGLLKQTTFQKNGALTLPEREGDVRVIGLGLGNRVNQDKWQSTQATLAIFGNLNLRPWSKLKVTPGLRFEPFLQNGDRILPVRPSEPEVGLSSLELLVSPRLRASLFLADAWTLFTSGGLYAQPANPQDLSPVFGNPTLEAQKAWQWLVGGMFSPSSTTQITTTGFITTQSNLAVRNISPTPPTARLLNSNGQGQNIGVQTDLRLALNNTLQLNTNYTFLSARRRLSDQATWRPFDQELKHQVRSSLSWSHPLGLRLSAQIEVSSGLPNTDVTGSVFNAAAQDYDPIFSGLNQDSLPYFLQASFRASFDHTRFRVWLDVINASNRNNVEDFVYTSDFSDRRPVYGLPIIPSLGAEIYL